MKRNNCSCYIQSALRSAQLKVVDKLVQTKRPPAPPGLRPVKPAARLAHPTTDKRGGSGIGGHGGWNNDGSSGYYSGSGDAALPCAVFAFNINRSTSKGSQLPEWIQQLKMTHVILALTVGIFALQLLLGDGFTRLGMKANDRIAAGELHRLVTAMFLHTGVMHLFINSISLVSTGPTVESWFGPTRFAALYAFSGITGNVMSYFCSPMPGVGASGAIFGLIGALTVLLVRHRSILHRGSNSALRSLAFTVLINFAIGLRPNSFIDNFAHLGGLLGGLAFTYVAGPRLLRMRTVVGTTVLVDRPLYIEAAAQLQSRWRKFLKAIDN